MMNRNSVLSPELKTVLGEIFCSNEALFAVSFRCRDPLTGERDFGYLLNEINSRLVAHGSDEQLTIEDVEAMPMPESCLFPETNTTIGDSK